ncbi:MFS transporter [Mangrovihabitans endophyticus]|uniref:MFS transporter n=1 Tax=Mangrovihabitans endophyticus TaxID=1751298 RepID=A0A8J3C2L1_9ACTN|nr:MFS transporter [Mangrovihabitans endophyticus]GGL00105.1 MFS transporter [Mangrovihabitans endophyticus]
MSRPTRLLQAASFVSTMDRFTMPPMLIVTARALGVPLSSVVHTASVYFLAYGLMQPVWGIVSDRLGRVRTLRITLLVAAFATAGSACAATVTQLGVARALAGAAFSAAIPAGLIYVGDTVPGRRRQTEVTNLMAGVALGTAVASAGAGALAQATSWRVAFVVSALCALTLVFLLRGLPEPVTDRPAGHLLAPLGRMIRSRATLLVLLLAFAEGGVLLGVLTLLPPAVEHGGASAAVAGAVTAVYGIAVLVFARVAGVLSRRWPVWRLIGAGALAAVAGCTLAAVSRTPVAAAAVAALIGLAWAAMHSSLQTWATEVLPSARATVVSGFAGALFAGSALSSALVAGPAEAGRYGAAFAALAIVAVPLGIGATLARARWRPVVATETGERHGQS